jgi:hypothetical protein
VPGCAWCAWCVVARFRAGMRALKITMKKLGKYDKKIARA